MHDISSQQSCLLDPSVVSKTCHFPPTFPPEAREFHVVWTLPNWQSNILCVCLESKEVGFTLRSWPFRPPTQIIEKQMQDGIQDQLFY